MSLRKTVQRCSICFAVTVIPLSILMILLGFHASSIAAEKKSLSYGAVSSSSGGFVYFVVAGKILNAKVPEINVTVRSTGGGVHNVRMLEKNEIDVGACDTLTTSDVVQGKGPFEGKPFTDLRLLVVHATNPWQFVISERSGVKDIYGLNGKIYCPGMKGGTAEKVALDIFGLLGVKPTLRHMSYADAVEAMKNEQIIGFTKGIVPDSSIMDVATAMKIRIISFSDADLEKIVNNLPGHKKVVIPAGAYPNVGEFKTTQNEWGDWVRKDFPADIAYKWVKTVWENRAEMKQLYPSFIADKFPEVTLGVKTNYLHPGAIKFYRELGLTVPKILIPPEAGEK